MKQFNEKDIQKTQKPGDGLPCQFWALVGMVPGIVPGIVPVTDPVVVLAWPVLPARKHLWPSMIL